VALQDLLRLLPRHDRQQLALASATQRALLDTYIRAHRDIQSRLQAQAATLEALRLPPSTLLDAQRSEALLAFIDGRIAFLNSAVSSALARSAPPTLALVQAQVRAEAEALGLPAPGVPDPGTLEKGLADAVNRIQSWNSAVKAETLAALRLGILKDESYSEIARRAGAVFHHKGAATPMARARAHMLANTRYALVHASNTARQEAYRDINRNTGIQVRKMWWADLSSCCYSCAQLHGTIVGLNEQFPWTTLGLRIKPYRGVLMHAPLHPNCRCRVIPVTADLMELMDPREVVSNRERRIRELSKN
jgi:hypothetical protein